MGATLYDVIWTGNVAPILVSDKVVELLTAEGVSGWGTYAVELRDKTRATVEGYSGFVVYGRCGPIRDELSPVVDVMRPGGITQMYKGWHFDHETWDGSDIFMPIMGGIRFARDLVRRLFVRHKIRNVKFIKATEDIRPIP